MDKHSEIVRNQFDKEYGDYDNFIKKVVPGYEEMHKSVMKLLKYPKDSELNVLDLGIGTGKTAKAILDNFPKATIVGYDISPNMLSLAKKHLAIYKRRVKFIEGDIKDVLFNKKYDACVSVLAIHHLNLREKGELYKKIFQALKDEGIFVNGEVVKQKTKQEEDKVRGEWENILVKNLGKKEALEKIELFKKEDLPDKLSDQIRLLKESGFHKVEETWNYSIYSVFFAKK
jgi:tRNA (cmo5U34)-methyltransferase